MNNWKLWLFGLLVCCSSLLSAQTQKDFIAAIYPIQGNEKAFLLLCSIEERAASKSSSSIFTTRLPTLPLRLNKWEESIFVLPGQTSPMQKIHLKDSITFTFPTAGICRKAQLIPDPDYPGEYILSLYWYEGNFDKAGKLRFSRIWSIVKLAPGKPEKLGTLMVKNE